MGEPRALPHGLADARRPLGLALRGAKREFAATANAIARFEPLTLIVNPGQADDARRHVSAAVEIVEIPIDDSWVRDSGPIGVVGAEGRRAGIDFRFNSWGERFLPYDKDAASGEAILDRSGSSGSSPRWCSKADR